MTSVKEPAPSQMPHASWPRSPWSAVRLLTRHAGVYRAGADAALGQGRHSACWSMGRQLVQMSVLGPFSEAWAQISVSLGPAWPGALGWGRWWHFLGDRLWEAWMLPCCDKCHGEGGSPAITPRIMRPSSSSALGPKFRSLLCLSTPDGLSAPAVSCPSPSSTWVRTLSSLLCDRCPWVSFAMYLSLSLAVRPPWGGLGPVSYIICWSFLTKEPLSLFLHCGLQIMAPIC